MAAPATNPTHSCLPRELAALVTAHLSPSALHNLFISSRTFGQQPTEELVTRLTLNVDELDLGGAHDIRRLSRLARLKHLRLSSGEAADDATHDQLSQTVILFTTLVPAMRQLTRLDLIGLPLSFLTAAASCLGAAAPPALSELLLDDVQAEPVAGNRARLPLLWPALARIATLRSLLLDPVHGSVPASDWKGLSALTQLQKLRIQAAEMPFSFLPAMPGLTQLLLIGVGSSTAGPSPSLAGFSKLQQLSIQDPTEGAEADVDSISWAGLTALTSLSIMGPELLLEEFPPRLSQHWASLTALLELPDAGAGVQLISVGSLDLVLGFQSSRDQFGMPVDPQSVAHTFPRLASLALRPPSPDPQVSGPTASQLWPSGSSGSMLHLRSLATSGECMLPLPLAEAAVALETLSLRNAVRLSTERGGADLLPALRLVGRHLLCAVLAGPKEGGGIDDEGMCMALDCWPHIRTMHVAGSCALTSIGLARLSHAECLRSVTLKECSAVTASGVAALAARRSVEHFGVLECPLVTLEEVKRIQRMVGRPQLTIDFPGL